MKLRFQVVIELEDASSSVRAGEEVGGFVAKAGEGGKDVIYD
jgi:hypothetical protein